MVWGDVTLCKTDPHEHALGSHPETSLDMIDAHMSMIQGYLSLTLSPSLIVERKKETLKDLCYTT